MNAYSQKMETERAAFRTEIAAVQERLSTYTQMVSVLTIHPSLPAILGGSLSIEPVSVSSMTTMEMRTAQREMRMLLKRFRTAKVSMKKLDRMPSSWKPNAIAALNTIKQNLSDLSAGIDAAEALDTARAAEISTMEARLVEIGALEAISCGGMGLVEACEAQIENKQTNAEMTTLISSLGDLYDDAGIPEESRLDLEAYRQVKAELGWGNGGALKDHIRSLLPAEATDDPAMRAELETRQAELQDGLVVLRAGESDATLITDCEAALKLIGESLSMMPEEVPAEAAAVETEASTDEPEIDPVGFAMAAPGMMAQIMGFNSDAKISECDDLATAEMSIGILRGSLAFADQALSALTADPDTDPEVLANCQTLRDTNAERIKAWQQQRITLKVTDISARQDALLAETPALEELTPASFKALREKISVLKLELISLESSTRSTANAEMTAMIWESLDQIQAIDLAMWNNLSEINDMAEDESIGSGLTESGSSLYPTEKAEAIFETFSLISLPPLAAGAIRSDAGSLREQVLDQLKTLESLYVSCVLGDSDPALIDATWAARESASDLQMLLYKEEKIAAVMESARDTSAPDLGDSMAMSRDDLEAQRAEFDAYIAAQTSLLQQLQASGASAEQLQPVLNSMELAAQQADWMATNLALLDAHGVGTMADLAQAAPDAFGVASAELTNLALAGAMAADPDGFSAAMADAIVASTDGSIDMVALLSASTDGAISAAAASMLAVDETLSYRYTLSESGASLSATGPTFSAAEWEGSPSNRPMSSASSGYGVDLEGLPDPGLLSAGASGSVTDTGVSGEASAAIMDLNITTPYEDNPHVDTVSAHVTVAEVSASGSAGQDGLTGDGHATVLDAGVDVQTPGGTLGISATIGNAEASASLSEDSTNFSVGAAALEAEASYSTSGVDGMQGHDIGLSVGTGIGIGLASPVAITDIDGDGNSEITVQVDIKFISVSVSSETLGQSVEYAARGVDHLVENGEEIFQPVADVATRTPGIINQVSRSVLGFVGKAADSMEEGFEEASDLVNKTTNDAIDKGVSTAMGVIDDAGDVVDDVGDAFEDGADVVEDGIKTLGSQLKNLFS